MKKSLFLMAAVLVASLVTPTYAAESRVNGNGYSNGEFLHNGQKYTFFHNFYSEGKGLGAKFETPADVTRQHAGLIGRFRTKSHGIDEAYSPKVDVRTTGISYAKTVHSNYGDSDVISPDYGIARVVILSNTTFKSDVRISF